MTADAAPRQALEQALARPDDVDVAPLATLAADDVESVLRAFAAAHGAAAIPVLTRLAAQGIARDVRRSARRALYRLAQRGEVPGPPPLARPVVERQAERAVRAWLSGVDGSGSRAAWIVFEGGYGGLELCSLIVNDVTGVVDAAGGEISKKRLDRELAALRADQKLPWVEVDPARALGLVAEALALHRAAGTTPPPPFARWRPRFDGVPVPAPPEPPVTPDPALVERSAALLDLPELAGWFFDPERVQSDALDLLQARESRLVVSDQIKAEREEAITRRVVERELPPDARRRWARRLLEMALVFEATDRADDAEVARAAAGALADLGRPAEQHPLARGLAARALEIAADVALGKVSATEVSRKPGGAAASS